MTMRYIPWVQAAYSYDKDTGSTINHGLVMGIPDIDNKQYFSVQPVGNNQGKWCPSYFYSSVSLAQSKYCDVTFIGVGLQDFPSDWETESWWGAYYYDESTGIYHNYYAYDSCIGYPCWCDASGNELSKSEVESIINDTHTFEHKRHNGSWVEGDWIPEEDNSGDRFTKPLGVFLGLKTSASGTIWHEYYNDDWSIYESEEIDASQVPSEYLTQIQRLSEEMKLHLDLFSGWGDMPENNFNGWGVADPDVIPQSEKETIPDGGNIVVLITLESDFHGSGFQQLNDDNYTQNYWIFQKIIPHNPLPCDIHQFPVYQQENFINELAIYYETTYYGYHIAYAKMGNNGFVSIEGREDIIDYTPYYLPY